MAPWILQVSTGGQIGFWDVVDVAVAAYLVYLLYKLLKGTVAFNIFIGVLLVYVLWWTVRMMNMSILSTILDQFVSVGVIILVIIFQPEIRRFLLLVGSTRLRSRLEQIERFFKSGFQVEVKEPAWMESFIQGVKTISDKGQEAVLVVVNHLNHDSYINSGVPMRADLSKELLESITRTDGPLADGAIILEGGKIISAGCALPTVSLKDNEEKTLKERSAVGISEQTNDFCVVIEAPHGEVKYSVAGELSGGVTPDELRKALLDHLNTTFGI